MSLRLAAAMLLASSSLAAAGRMPVIVELFTSQGCSSCPPAEALMATLDEEQPLDGIELIPLAFHVSYWDYLGWKDPHASLEFTQRQYGYAGIAASSQVYTPQAVINGARACVGHERQSIFSAARELRAAPLILSLKNGQLRIEGLQPGLPLYLAVTTDAEDQILRGENEGLRARGHAIVVSFEELHFEGSRAKIKAPGAKAPGAIVVFQSQAAFGPIMAAGRLKL